MAGLLYKDFVAIKGKLYVRALCVVTVLLVLLRILVQSDEIEILLGMLLPILPIFLLLMTAFRLEIDLVAVDACSKNRLYLLSMPMEKKDYVASKYWFLLISYYVVLSLSQIWAISFFICDVADETIVDFVRNFATMMPIVVCGFVLLAAIELPFFLLLGARRGKMVKTAIVIVFYFAITAFLLFGDLALLDYLNFEKLFLFLETHVELLLGLQICLPIITLFLYYCSYKLTLVLFERREGDYEP